MLRKASSLEPVSDEDLSGVPVERRRLLHTISRVSRSANFREKVLNAYGHRCAITRMQLRLVEAAHILPVAASGSTDQIKNGLALSPTYHRAFDNGLIFVDTEHVMRINPTKSAQLRKLNLTAGLPDFKAHLGKIHLPADRTQWPHPSFIRKANKLRGIG